MAIRFTIDDREVTAEKGELLLDVARRHRVEIPSLCHHEALPPTGACRVCLVEVTVNGRTTLTTSCNYPVEEGMEVATDSEEVRKNRAMNLELLLSRAPDSETVRQFASRYGVTKPRFAPPAHNPLPNCILCKLCVRACEHLGNNVLTLVGRGDKQRVGMAFNKPSESCTGCASCASVCPTNCIFVKDTATDRTIWGQKLPFLRCQGCGAPIMTERQKTKMIAKKALPEDYYDLCESCKRTAASKRFAGIVW
jgi:bidirectional [NiFe] hydrogenase diaphorase subunit